MKTTPTITAFNYSSSSSSRSSRSSHMLIHNRISSRLVLLSSISIVVLLQKYDHQTCQLFASATTPFNGNNNINLNNIYRHQPSNNDDDDDGSDDSNNSNNDDNNNKHQRYSLNQHMSFDPRDDQIKLSAETETVTFFKSNNADGDDTTITGSSSNNAALFCSGGGSEKTNDTASSLFVTVSECRFGRDVNPFTAFDSDFDEDDEEDESDDEDDDDDDGHGMMLSNASLRRSLVGANGGVKDYNEGSFDKERRTNRRTTTTTTEHPGSGGNDRFPLTQMATMPFGRIKRSYDSRRSFPSTPFSTLSHSLSVRGGSTTPTLHSLSVRRAGATTPTTTSSQSSEFAKRLLVAALVTLLYEALLGHFLEFVKIVMQTSPPSTTYADVVRRITAEKGIAGIWDGFVPWGVIQSVFKGGVFGLAHAMAKSYLQPLIDGGILPKQLGLTLAGGIAGGFQGFVLSPTLLLKTRVMTNDVFREKMSLWKTTFLSLTIGMDVVREEGLGALMKGSGVFATKRVFDWATRFYFSDVFGKLLVMVDGKTEGGVAGLSPLEKIVADLLGGTASTLSTLPLDVMVAKTQDAKKAGVKVSVIKMFLDELNEKGWVGLKDSYMNGFEARLAHVCFTTVAMKTGTGLMYNALFGEKK